MIDRPLIELSEPLTKRLQRVVRDSKYLLLGKLSRFLLMGGGQPDFDDLKIFCCFVGHGRSGGTLVGALLNAHPNIVMSNELNALRRLRTGLTAAQLYRVIYLVSARQVRRGSKGGGGYSYEVSGQWQGKHRELTIIGDRKAGATAYEIVCNPDTLATLERKVSLDKKFIHVIRNPFDTITTTYLKTSAKAGQSADEHLSREIRNYFARSSAIHQIEKQFGASAIHHLHHELLIADPNGQLRGLCRFLGVEPLEDYLRDCAGILKKSPHQSRKSLDWPERQIAEVNQRMKACPWLAEYALSS